VLTELVLADIQRVSAFVRDHREEFLRKAKSCEDKNAETANIEIRQQLAKGQSRASELDTILRKLYEDNVFGRVSNQQFTIISSGFEDERKALAEKIAALENQFNQKDADRSKAANFVRVIEQYEHITELTYNILHAFIERINLGERDKKTNIREIEIIYKYVGRLDGSGDKPINESHWLKLGNNGNIKSLVK